MNMARSYSIWLVCKEMSGDPVCAFTVKHELVSWLLAQEKRQFLHIWKLRDNDWRQAPIAVSIEELFK
jgi:hypothetical protein